MSKIQFNEIVEGHLLAENDWTCEIDGNDVELGLHIEILNMDDATGEPEYKTMPYLVSVSIVASNPHESFNESDDDKPDRFSLVYDAVSYMGGVPVDDKLLGMDPINKDLMGALKAKDAMLVTRSQDFGTLAARGGKGASMTYPQFKTYEAAERFAKALVNEYAGAVMGLVGFTLDQPINMMGDDGWGVIRKMVEGCK